KEISYYDPNKHKFIIEMLPAQTVTVTGTAAIAGNQSSLESLKPLTGLAVWVEHAPKILYDYWWFWLGLFFPLVLISVAYWRKSYTYKMATNQFFARSKNAASRAHLELD